MHELGKTSSIIKIILNILKKHICFSLDNKLAFIDIFQFLGSSFDSLVKHLGKNDF